MVDFRTCNIASQWCMLENNVGRRNSRKADEEESLHDSLKLLYGLKWRLEKAVSQAKSREKNSLGARHCTLYLTNRC